MVELNTREIMESLRRDDPVAVLETAMAILATDRFPVKPLLRFLSTYYPTELVEHAITLVKDNPQRHVDQVCGKGLTLFNKAWIEDRIGECPNAVLRMYEEILPYLATLLYSLEDKYTTNIRGILQFLLYLDRV